MLLFRSGCNVFRHPLKLCWHRQQCELPPNRWDLEISELAQPQGRPDWRQPLAQSQRLGVVSHKRVMVKRAFNSAKACSASVDHSNMIPDLLSRRSSSDAVWSDRVFGG